jgi:hypothetical protein
MNPAKIVTASAASQRGKSGGDAARPDARADAARQDGAGRRAAEPMIYKPPHAPDDPGLDDGLDEPRRTKDQPRDVPRDGGRDSARGSSTTVQIRPGRGNR